MLRPWALFSCTLLAAGVALAEPVAPARPLKPGPDDATVTRVIASQLVQLQYLHRKLDDAAASQFLDRYLDALDPQHLYFTQADLEEFAPLRTTLDEKVRTEGDTRPAYDIFNRLLERVQQYTGYVENALKTETFTFEGMDAYTVDRRKAARPKDLAEAKQLWHDRLRYDYLQEKLNNKKPEEIVKTLDRRYDSALNNLRQIDSGEVLELFLTSLAHVFDPHSDYMGPSSFEDFNIRMKLSLFGIGATLQSEDGYCKIVQLVPGGPAARSGQLNAGDRIVGVAQGKSEPVDVIGWKLDRVVDLIRGPKDTEVRLTIIPAGSTDDAARKVITLVRDEIKLEEQEAKAKVIDLPVQDGKNVRLGLIDLPSFYAGGAREGRKSCTDDVARLLKKLQEANVQGVVLDLRENPGGSLDEAIRLTGLFIKDGPVVQVKDPTGEAHADRDPDPSIAYAGPLVVLTSRHSASASEILAGALQDYGRAVIVGDSSTFGKGTVQSLMPLGPLFRRAQIPTHRDPGAMKLTIQKFYRPSGASTQLKGVAADVVVPSLTDNDHYSEGAMDSPLPWDTIPSSNFHPTDQVKPYVDALRKRSADRINADKDFVHLRDEVERARKTSESRQVSLNEAERRKTRAEAEARAKAWTDDLASRPPSRTKTYTITLKQAGMPGLPAPDPATTKPSAQAEPRPISTAPKPVGPDLILEEGERVLVDLINLSHGKQPEAM